MPVEFTNPSYVQPGSGGGTEVKVATVANQSARLALLQASANGKLIEQADDGSVWCLIPGGSAASVGGWKKVAHSSRGTMAAQDANAVAITGGSISGVTLDSIAFSDPAAVLLALGLNNLNNTADSAKPVSTAQAAAIAAAASSHTHAQEDVTGLAAALAGKADTAHTHAQADVTGLVTSLDDLVASIGAAGGVALVRSELEGPPVNAVSAEFLSNQTIRLATTSSFSLPGGTISWSNEDYVFKGYNSGTGAGRWEKSSTRVIYWDAGYWYISALSFFGLVLLRAAGAFNADPSALTYAHAPGSEGSGGGLSLVALSGTFVGDAGTAAAYLFQPCIVGDAGGPFAVYVSTSLSPTRWFEVASSGGVLQL